MPASPPTCPDFAEFGRLPLPGSGSTWIRWRALAEVAARDLSAARLGEGHADAVAILAELAPDLGVPPGVLGVWAAEAPRGGLRAERTGDTWRIDGIRRWCSGADAVVTRPVVTAHAPDGLRLFLLDGDDPGIGPVEGTWPAVGMAATASLEVRFDGVRADEGATIGRPGDYLQRPGFWHGAMGVAACWFGGALGVARTLLAAACDDPDPHRLAHLGAVDATLVGLAIELRDAAGAIDADPGNERGIVEQRARRLRASVERGCEEVLVRTGRATGATPLCLDPAHARRVADLTVYLRQSHAEKDLAHLGELALEHGDGDWLPS